MDDDLLRMKSILEEGNGPVGSAIVTACALILSLATLLLLRRGWKLRL
jgi:hypothetical protein